MITKKASIRDRVHPNQNTRFDPKNQYLRAKNSSWHLSIDESMLIRKSTMKTSIFEEVQMLLKQQFRALETFDLSRRILLH